MPANPSDPHGPAPHVKADLEELKSGVNQLHGLAEDTKSMLVSSDQALSAVKSAWRGMQAAGVFAAYAEFEMARGKAMTDSFGRAGDNVAHAAEQYGHTDGANAAALRMW